MRNVSFLAICLCATSALAGDNDVPLDILVDHADLIVVGKVSKVQDGGFFTVGPQKSDHIVKQDVALVEVSAILKTSGRIGKPKVVQIGQSAGKEGPEEIRFRAGQEGIWLLTRDSGSHKVCEMKNDKLVMNPDRDVFWARLPGQLQGENERKKLVEIIEKREKIDAGKPVNGLVARAEVGEKDGAFDVRVSLKNVSDKAITICDYVGNRHLQVKWVDPDGKSRKSNHYDWLAAAFIPAIGPTNFVTIQPGGVRHISPGPGILFRSAAEKNNLNGNLAQPGTHKITVSFVQTVDGKNFGIENVWLGTVTANEVNLKVK